MRRRDELLTRLRSDAGLMYMSDMHLPAYWPQIRHAAQQLRKAGYTLDDWAYAASYITGQHVAFRSEDELTRFLEQRTSQPMAEKSGRLRI